MEGNTNYDVKEKLDIPDSAIHSLAFVFLQMMQKEQDNTKVANQITYSKNEPE